MITVTKELIKELAEDIMIEISDDEVEKIFSTEQKMESEFLKLTKMDVAGIDPMHYPFDQINIYLRDDSEVPITITKEAMLKNAVSHDEDYVLIKKVVK